MALALAAMMLLCSVAFAEGSISLKGDITNVTDDMANKHSYKVYQIFTGTLTGKELSDVKYGANYGDTGALVPKTTLDEIGTNDAAARAFAVTASAALHGDPVETLNSSNNFSVTGLADGYYLIVDDTQQTLDKGDAFSRYLVRVLGTEQDVVVKKEVPTSDKAIDDDTLGAGESNTTLAGDVTTKTDNVSIGDTVTFKLTAHVPTTASDYSYYYFILNDTLSEGLTFDDTSVEVYKESVDADNKLTAGADKDYVLYTGTEPTNKATYADGKTFQIAMMDAKSLAGKDIIVSYKATLNEKAKINDVANPNTFDVTYSNQPHHDYNGDKTTDNPGKPDSTKTVPTGTTPEARTETFTTGVKIRKIDENGLSLKGATFTFEGESMAKIVRYTEAFVEDTTDAAKYWKLTNGTYTDQAPKTADTMDEAEAGATAGYVVADAGYDGADKVTVGTTDYRPYKLSEDNGKTVYILNKKNSEQYASTTTKYKKTSTQVVENEPAAHKTETLTVNDDGTLIFSGLGAGNYKITEIAAPTGYNKLDGPIEFTIAFNAAPATGASHWTITGHQMDDEGYFIFDVKNKAGTTLPETGGIGTTIFYVAGSIMVLAAAILLITKRRMGAND